MNREIAVGSIADLAKQNNQSIAETFLSCDCIVLIDVSGSMCSEDCAGKSRYDRACDALKNLQASMPGKIAVVRFSDEVKFEPSGVPFFEGAGTDLRAALQFIKIADVPDMRFVVISDGNPDEPQASLSIASTFSNHLDVIFIGDERDSYAIKFMNDLARASGGKQITTVSEKIAEATRLLLE